MDNVRTIIAAVTGDDAMLRYLRHDPAALARSLNLGGAQARALRTADRFFESEQPILDTPPAPPEELRRPPASVKFIPTSPPTPISVSADTGTLLPDASSGTVTMTSSISSSGAPAVPAAPGVPGVPTAPGVPGVPHGPVAPAAPFAPSAPFAPFMPAAPFPPQVPGLGPPTHAPCPPYTATPCRCDRNCACHAAVVALVANVSNTAVTAITAIAAQAGRRPRGAASSNHREGNAACE